MNVLRGVASELLGLFVDDWAFALAIAAWLGAVAIGATLGIGDSRMRGILLFAGLAAILVASVASAARKR